MPSSLAKELDKLTSVDVFCHGKKVGTIAQLNRQPTTFFSYDSAWLADGFSISPFSLPLQAGVFAADANAQDGIFGIFRDSLPDDWGRAVQDRRMANLGIDPATLTPLIRLALVGATGLGTLEYAPSIPLDHDALGSDYDAIATSCLLLMEDEETDMLDAIYAHGSSSGGARPKVMVDFDGEPWIVKFPASFDSNTIGAQEYEYSLLARECNIVVPQTCLIESRICSGFFASKRFDREALKDGTIRKLHMASASALLEVSPFDTLDYRDLMELSLALTNDVRNSEQLYRVMCFNVLMDNCDDHARNFSFLYDQDRNSWSLAPAYDLTRSKGFYGEHATLVNGKGANILEQDLVSVGVSGGVSARRCAAILRDMRDRLRSKATDLS